MNGPSEASLIDEDARDEKGDAPETGDAADAPEESFFVRGAPDFSGRHISRSDKTTFSRNISIDGAGAACAAPFFWEGKNFGRNPF